MDSIKLKIGVPDYAYEAQGEVIGGKLRGRKEGRDIKLLLLSVADMRRMHAQHAIRREGDKDEPRSSIRGCPVYVAYDAAKGKLWVYPTADGDYDLLVAEAMPVRPPAPPVDTRQSIVGTITKAVLKTTARQ